VIDYKEVFLKGVPEYGPGIMWYPHEWFEPEEITYQLEGFKKAGIKDFFIQSSLGLRIEYLSDTYFERIKHVVREAERLGLNYWIYDEYEYPSGTAGGKVIRDHPWARAVQVVMLKLDADPGESITHELPSIDKYNVDILRCCILKDDVLSETEIEISDDKVIWTNHSGMKASLLVFFKMWSSGPCPAHLGTEFSWGQEGLLDALDEEAVRLFIEYTHERYKKEIGEYFGTIVKGVFTDEVHVTSPYNRPDYFKNSKILPWSRKFEEKFFEMHNYDVKTVLPHLFIDLGEEKTARPRYDFWLTIREMYINAYMRQTHDWCEKNGLIYTGHGGGEETLRAHLESFADICEMSRYFDMPGIDIIFPYFMIDYYDFNVTPKYVSSAARFLGRKRILSETFTGSTWAITLREMKRIANRLFLFGVNYIQFMGAYYSINNYHKSYDGACPPSHNWQNTLFKHYDIFNKYLSSMSWLVSNTEICARALVLAPYATARALGGGPDLREGGEHLGLLNVHPLKDQDLTIQGLVNALSEMHVPFEIGFEQFLDSAIVKDGLINMCGMSYDTLILPAVKYVTTGTARVLTEFAKQGGRVVFVNGLPETDIEKKESFSVNDLLTLDNVRVVECFDYDIISPNTRAKAGAFFAAIKKSLEGIKPYIADIEYTDGIMSVFRQNQEDNIIIIINDAAETRTARGRIYSNKNIQVLSPGTGSEKQAKLIYDGNTVSFEIELESYECVVIIASDRHSRKEPAQLPVLTEEKQCRIKSLTPCGKNYFAPRAYVVNGDKLIRCAYSHDENTNDDYVGWQLPVDEKIYDRINMTAVYSFDVDSWPDSVELITEPECETTWFVNSTPVTEFRTERIWSVDNKVFEIAPLLKKGKNCITVVAKYPPIDVPNGAPLVVLRGDFRVYNWTMTLKEGGNKADYWNGQGYQHYAGDMVYESNFTYDGSGRVILKLDTPDVAEAFVNGKSAGRRLWEPYEFDITELCREGENDLKIKITSPLGSLFFRPTMSGLRREPLIRIYK